MESVTKLLMQYRILESQLAEIKAKQNDLENEIWRKQSSKRSSAHFFRESQDRINLSAFRETAHHALDSIPKDVTIMAADCVFSDLKHERTALLSADHKEELVKEKLNKLSDAILEKEPLCYVEAIEKGKFLCATLASVENIEIDYFVLMIAECLEIAGAHSGQNQKSC